MKGSERREKILALLEGKTEALSASALGSILGVSRQAIVQDIALLRTAGYGILSTHRGYVLQPRPYTVHQIFKVCHSDDQIEDELQTLVDLGCVVEDVFINHRIYGCLRAGLHIASRWDIHLFLQDLANGVSTPLKNITGNYHYHTVTASSEACLALAGEALRQKGYLLELNEWDRRCILAHEGL